MRTQTHAYSRCAHGGHTHVVRQVATCLGSHESVVKYLDSNSTHVGARDNYKAVQRAVYL